MPSMSFADLQPKRFKVELIPPPITEVESSTGWTMSYHTAKRPQELFYVEQGFGGLGDNELHELEKLPKKLVQALYEEVEADPNFVQDYLVSALQSPNPYETILNDITEDVYSEEAGLGDLGKSRFKKIVKKVRTTTKKVVKFERKLRHKITPKPLLKIQKKVHATGKKVWKKYGNTIISIVGAVLAPFTGGASMAAAAVIVAANQMYAKKKAADAARRAAKADAGLIAQEAANQEAQVAAQVDAFYNENQAWFLQYDMTPDKWAKLTLEQKIEFINAGTSGKLPAGTQNVDVSPEQAAAQTQATAQAASSAGIPQGAVAPPGAGPGEGYDTSAGGAPPPEEPAAQSSFEAIVEGKSIGTFPSADDAFNSVLAVTTPGDRFEIIAGGKSLGLAIRTGDGAVEVPPEAEAQMRAVSKEEAHKIVEKADEEVAAKKGGGFPWLLVLAGGVAVAAATTS